MSPFMNQIVSGAGDEHHVLTTPSGQLLQLQRKADRSARHPPKFSSIVNEYVGACMEDNCNIGKKRNKNSSAVDSLLSKFPILNCKKNTPSFVSRKEESYYSCVVGVIFIAWKEFATFSTLGTDCIYVGRYCTGNEPPGHLV